MFLRRCVRRKNGKAHTYWALVESYRTSGGSRQRVVAYLGELEGSEQSGWAQLGRTVSGQRRTEPQPSLFDPPVGDERQSADEPVLVRLSGIRLERLRDFGDVWLGWGLWRLLELDRLLEKLIPAGREEVAWPTTAAILTIARFCEPSSELHIEETWYRRTALEELLGVPPAKVHTDRLYAGLDRILPHKSAIEKHLKERLGDLFDLRYDLLLYDLTSTYFEGQCAGNPQAKRGHSRDSRPDCLQVIIALVVTEDGVPLGYEVLPGNRNDSTTLKEIVDAVETKYGKADRIWVMDRGVVSEENLRFLREHQGSYIVGTPKATLRRFEQHLTEQDWQEVQAGIEVKAVSAPEGTETFLLARSKDRREKEKAMHDRFVQRLEAELTKLTAAADKGRLCDEGVAQRRLGRILQRCWRARDACKVTITCQLPPAEQPVNAKTGRKSKGKPKPKLTITWQRNEAWRKWNALAEGCYLLRTNLVGVEPAVLWKRYMQLADAEWAFRIAKDELEIRPIWHQKEGRVQAHILVCFLAYVLWKTLGQWMQRSGLGDAPRTLLEEFHKIKSGDIVLPTETKGAVTGREVRLRCVTEPDPAQKTLLNRLGLTLPKRLRRLDQIERM